MSSDPNPIMDIVKQAQEGAARWERTELRNRADKDRLPLLKDRARNLAAEIVAKQKQLEQTEREVAELAATISKQEEWLHEHMEQYRTDKELGSDEVVKKLQAKLDRQLKELAKTQAELEEAKA